MAHRDISPIAPKAGARGVMGVESLVCPEEVTSRLVCVFMLRRMLY